MIPSDPVTEAVWAAAAEVPRGVGLQALQPLRLPYRPEGHPWFLEAGLYCSFARKSVVVMMAEAAGIPIDELFDTSVRQAAGGPRSAYREWVAAEI